MSKKIHKTTATTTNSISPTGTVCLYHGTDAISADRIITEGVSEELAIEALGDGTFWATKSLEKAAWFATVCPNAENAEPTVLKIHIQQEAFSILSTQDTPSVIEHIELEAYEFLPPGFSVVNSAITSVEKIEDIQKFIAEA